MTLLAALLVEREREVTDSLVDLLIATVHRIGARAERKVTNELINAFKRVSGKENILFQIAEASLAEQGGEISTNRREEVEMAALCLRILQASLVFVNTVMLQAVLAESQWSSLLTPADRRGLTPLFWQHVRPYGEVRLDMGSRLQIGGTDLGGLG